MGSDWWCRTNWWCRHGLCLFQGFWTFHGTDITRIWPVQESSVSARFVQCTMLQGAWFILRKMFTSIRIMQLKLLPGFSGYGTQEASLATLTLQYMLAILQLCQGSFQRLPSLFQAWVALCGWTLDFWNASHALQTLVGCHFSCRKVTSESADHSGDVHHSLGQNLQTSCPQQNVAWFVIQILLAGLQQAYDKILHWTYIPPGPGFLRCRGSVIREIQRWQGWRWDGSRWGSHLEAKLCLCSSFSENT